MIGCNQIKKQIDEANRPDQLSFEAVNHLTSCSGCQGFAAERAKLRGLLASTARVTVPMNFDAELSRRLREQTAGKTFSWFGPALYLRFGAAAAMLLVAVFAAQYSDFLSEPVVAPKPPTDMAKTPDTQSQPPTVPIDNKPQGASTKELMAENAPSTVTRSQRPAQYRAAPDTSLEQPSDLTAADIPVIIVMGRNGEIEVPMPTVNVGAQSLLYANAGGQTPRTVRTSF